MGLRKLRVYNGPDNDAAGVSLLEQQLDPHGIKVPLGEILPILADAVSSDRTWLSDFAEDEDEGVTNSQRHFKQIFWERDWNNLNQEEKNIIKK